MIRRPPLPYSKHYNTVIRWYRNIQPSDSAATSMRKAVVCCFGARRHRTMGMNGIDVAKAEEECDTRSFGQ